MLGGLFGHWTLDGRQFFAWNHVPYQRPPAPSNLHRWSGGDDIEQVAVGEHGIRDVYGFLAFPSAVLDGHATP